MEHLSFFRFSDFRFRINKSLHRQITEDQRQFVIQNESQRRTGAVDKNYSYFKFYYYFVMVVNRLHRFRYSESVYELESVKFSQASFDQFLNQSVALLYLIYMHFIAPWRHQK